MTIPHMKNLIVSAFGLMAVAFLLINVVATSAASAAGEVDVTFNAGGAGANGGVSAVAVQYVCYSCAARQLAEAQQTARIDDSPPDAAVR
ncbi:MAG: hypothetical protein ACR2G4_13405 [Pyrinomonadaceae bacterium]